MAAQPKIIQVSRPIRNSGAIVILRQDEDVVVRRYISVWLKILTLIRDLFCAASRFHNSLLAGIRGLGELFKFTFAIPAQAGIRKSVMSDPDARLGRA